MIDIERICEKIREEKDNIVAKAFTCQIASLLLTNGIVPIMSEYSKKDLEEITDANRYQLVYELGVTFDSLDTSRHDAQVRAETISEISREMRVLYENEYEKKIRTDAIEEYNQELKVYLRRFSVKTISDEDFDYVAEQLKENRMDDEIFDDDCPCDVCPSADACDGWEARFCCRLCEYLGSGDCDDCDPMDI